MFTYPEELEHGTGVMMRREPSYLLLALRPPPEAKGLQAGGFDFESGIDRVLGEVGLRLLRRSVPPTSRSMADERLALPSTIEINDSDRLHWVMDPAEQPINEARSVELEAAFARDNQPLQWSGPTFRMPGTTGLNGLVCPAPDVLLVRPRPGLDEARFSALMDEIGLDEDIERSSLLVGFRYFRLRSLESESAYDIRSRLRRDLPDLIETVRLENIPLLRPTLFEPNDPAYREQWNMKRIEAGGTGATGWDITAGSPEVMVGIIDSGCDLRHRDLDYACPGISIADLSTNAHEATREHGTKVAGIACAVFDNGLGVAGLAGRCRVLPVKIEGSDASLAQGITWAARHGARVINLSVGMQSDSGWDFEVIDPSIEAAYDAGCVLCAATGNRNREIRYPARHPLVMACGASDRSDERWVDRDHGSNYGDVTYLGRRTGVSVVAPGIRIPTTDLDDGKGDATGIFGMTSAAAPHVSGLAALVISKFGLANDCVRTIIEESADRVGSVPYAADPGFPNGPRNAEMGYGRINVLRALRLAAGEDPDPGPGRAYG